MRVHTLSLGLLLVLPACAYQQAVTRGNRAAAAEDWDKAYEAYRYADQIKPGKAEEELRTVKFASAGAELAAAERALASRDYAKAMAHVHKAAERDPSHMRLEEVRSSVRETLAEELATRMEGGEGLRETYALAVLAKRLDPTSPEFEDATAALRDRIAAETQSLVKKRQYAEARAMARTIGEVEPEHATRGSALDAEVTDGWVAALVDDAKEAEGDRPGLAAVYYARAYEVGGREAHKAAVQKMLEKAAPAADLAVYVDSDGDGGRHWKVRKALRGALDASPGVKDGWESSWDLQAKVYTNAERCKETKVAKPLAQDWVSGTKQVPNPAQAQVTAQLDAAIDVRDAAKAELTKAKAKLETVNAAAWELELARNERSRDYETALARQLDTNKQLEMAKERQVGLTGDEATKQTAIVAQWTQKAAADAKAVDAAKKALDAANTKLAPAQALAQQQTATTKEIEDRHAAADKTVAELWDLDSKTPEKLTQDVVETFKYAETTWTLSCDVATTVYFGTRWKSELAKKQTFPGHLEVTDVARPGHEGAKIEEDPKQYPRQQWEMVAELETTTNKAMATAIEAFVDEHFDRKLESALTATSGVGSATNTLMTVYAGAPERMDDGVRTRLVEHLKTRYGIENPALLGIVPVQAAPPAKDEVPPKELTTAMNEN